MLTFKWKAWWHLLKSYNLALLMWLPVKYEGVYQQQYGKRKLYHKFSGFRGHFEVYDNGEVFDYDSHPPMY